MLHSISAVNVGAAFLGTAAIRELEMKKEVEKAIENLVSEIKEGVDADKALKISQAALNLANCQSVMSSND